MEQTAACLANPACGALNQCVGMCSGSTDMVCINGCTLQHPDGVEDFNAVVACVLEGQCSTACSDGGGGGSTCDTSATCDACISCAVSGDCQDEAAACGMSSDCSAINACVEQCPVVNATCIDNCTSQHPDGSAAWLAMDACIYGSQCPTLCQ